MKFSKELEEKIDKEISRYEQAKREGKIKFYSQEEAMKIMFKENHIAGKV